LARLAGVFLRDGVQREHRSLEHSFDREYGRCMRPLPSPACAACVAWRGMRRCVACLPSAAADRACGGASFCRASLILPCFTHFSRVYLAYSVVRTLSESVWFGVKAFDRASVFNGDIAAWNTARMTTMSYVCAHCFTRFSSIITRTTDGTEALSGFAPAQPPQLRRISTVERQYIPPHALGPLDAACTIQWTDPSALGADSARSL
jgi:hypothetical protein